MRIAILIPKLDPLRGGAESWTYRLGMDLLARRHDVHFAALKFDNCDDLSDERQHRLPAAKTPIATAKLVEAWLGCQRFDIVHDMGLGLGFDILQPHLGSYIAHDQARDKSFSRWQRWGRALIAPFRRRQKANAKLAKLQFQSPHAKFIAVSPMVKRDLCRFHGVSPDQVHVIMNGVDVERFHPARCVPLRDKTRYKLGISDNDLALLIVAHNHALKGVPLLLETLRRAHNFPLRMQLIVAGGHRQRPHTIQVGKHHVIYTGAIKDVLPLYAAADGYVHPTHYDACCLSLLEAMACELPTITTTINGASAAVEHGQNGWLIDDPRDPTKLELALRQLVDREARQRVGEAARCAMQWWTEQHNYLAVEQLYEETLHDKHSAHKRRAA